MCRVVDTGGWLSGVERGGHSKFYQMVSREVKRIRGRGGNWDTTTDMTEVVRWVVG